MDRGPVSKGTVGWAALRGAVGKVPTGTGAGDHALVSA